MDHRHWKYVKNDKKLEFYVNTIILYSFVTTTKPRGFSKNDSFSSDFARIVYDNRAAFYEVDSDDIDEEV